MKRVKTRVFLAMKNGVRLLQKKICWGPTFYCSKQNKRKLKAKIKTLKEKHIVYEALCHTQHQKRPRPRPSLQPTQRFQHPEEEE
jgi:hypothetical protein